LIAEFWTKRSEKIREITAELNKEYDPLERECFVKESAAKAALKKLQEEDCPCLPHRAMRYCEVCGWNLDR
jgi:hypothetical protein